jgi:hypothetical protein
MTETIIHWNQTYSYRTEIHNDTVLNTLLFSDDQVLLSESEDDLQTALYILIKNIRQFGTKISPLKSTVMTFKVEVPVRSKNVIDTRVLEQMNT